MAIFLFCTTGLSSWLNVVSGERMVQSPRSSAALQWYFSTLYMENWWISLDLKRTDFVDVARSEPDLFIQ